MSVVENLALDMALLTSVGQGCRRPLFWLWDWAEPGVILGSYQSVMNEVDREFCEEHDFEIARRISGGGAMVVEPNRTLTWSMIVPESVVADMSPAQSFAFLDSWAVRTLRGLGVPATYRPINDIASPLAKMGGAAQCRRKKTVLHHVTMAYELDRETLYGALRLGRQPMSDKGIPSARKEVSPLRMFTHLTLPEVRESFASSFMAQYRTHVSELLPEEIATAAQLMREKFNDPAWMYRVP